MKRLLLLPLLCFTSALSTSFLAGDLGPADLNVDIIPEKHKFSKRIFCGNPIGKQPNCTVEFKDGLLLVDGKYGIKPVQVRSFNLSGTDSYAKKFEIIYLSEGGIIRRAQISIVFESDVNSFYKSFLEWLNANEPSPSGPTPADAKTDS